MTHWFYTDHRDGIDIIYTHANGDHASGCYRFEDHEQFVLFRDNLLAEGYEFIGHNV